ncbi:ABC transporter ATP-binding protein [Leptospira sp. GIMC2001]|uniref:ABC transporter ATP-binding protein n=1 Tax=Leptospira sp. GIMC2001 TaxID=1513297 RepID=UPI00234AB9F7|nr:ABC transporter ATP-binding protein [Leptospira sp. GIMC2001]WCL51145.1 ABC transporter ATP-binding protein [Leptospira sp. GIMC2001]
MNDNTTLALEINSLTKTYSNGMQALKGIDLNVSQGDFFALLGPNGAGKSTTIGIISSLVNKTSGTVKVFGVDINSESEKAKSLIGIVPQEFNFGIFENIKQIILNQAGYYGIPRKIASEKADHYLNVLGLSDKKHLQAGKLSGGMKRRLMIARALVHEPKLLILDEPTAGVDIELRRSMWDFLIDLNRKGTTIILTTHYLEEAENLCKNIAIIDRGKIVQNSSMKKLLESLDSENIILDLRAPVSSEIECPGMKIHMIDDQTLDVSFSRNTSLNSLFRVLDQSNIEVLSMRNKSNRLEELFLNLVEKSL